MDEDTKKTKSEKEEEFMQKVRRRLKQVARSYSSDKDAAIEDLKFLNGDQWDDDERQRRKNRKRPCLTINMLPEKVDEVVGDMRQNRARIKIKPVSSDASADVAKVREGIIRDIEYRSNAQAIYDYAGGRMAECGFGTWRYCTRYCEDNPFVQEIYMEVIKNSFSVMIDPNARQPNKSDAKWAFIATMMDKEDFEEKYPDKTVPSATDMNFGEGLDNEHWYNEKAVLVCEYFEVGTEKKQKSLMDDGSVIDFEEAKKLVDEWNQKYGQMIKQGPPAPGVSPSILLNANQGQVAPTENAGGTGTQGPTGVPPVPGGGPLPSSTTPPQAPMMPMMPQASIPKEPKVLQTKDVESRFIQRWIVSGTEILEGPVRIPGKYIPIVEITGKERDIEGKTSYRGIVRDGKDPQKLVNYWNTSGAEMVALAPKAPWMGTAKQFEGYEEDYANANVDSFPFLKYNVDPKTTTPPQRNHPGDPPIAIFSQMDRAERNLHRVVGIGMDVREAAPDASSKALIQRRKPTELSTYVFVDNLAQGILFGGKILNEMIPEIYDTERDVNIRAEDDTEFFAPINMKAEDAIRLIEKNPDRYGAVSISRLRHIVLQKGKDFRFNDVGAGKYSVIVDLGPSYSTQREEAAESFVKLAQTNPKMWDTHGDLIVENLDMVGANKMAARFRKIINPRLLEPKPGEALPPPPPPPPAVQLLMEKSKTEQLKQKKEALRARVEMIKLYKETKETDKEIRKEIISVLQELHGVSHFSDKVIPGMEEPNNNQGGEM